MNQNRVGRSLIRAVRSMVSTQRGNFNVPFDFVRQWFATRLLTDVKDEEIIAAAAARGLLKTRIDAKMEIPLLCLPETAMARLMRGIFSC